MELLKIGDFARLAGTNLRTLRYYEEVGLLMPASRSQGGFRYYRPEDLNRLNMIRDLQGLGLQLEQIRDLMTAPRDSGEREAMLERVRSALKEQDRLIAERIERLQAQRSEIAHALEKMQACDCCPHTPCAENNYCEPCRLTGEKLPSPISALF